MNDFQVTIPCVHQWDRRHQGSLRSQESSQELGRDGLKVKYLLFNTWQRPLMPESHPNIGVQCASAPSQGPFPGSTISCTPTRCFLVLPSPLWCDSLSPEDSFPTSPETFPYSSAGDEGCRFSAPCSSLHSPRETPTHTPDTISTCNGD